MTALAAFVALLGQEDDLLKAALKGYRHPWEEFGSGSTVTMRETIKRPEVDASGKLVMKDEALVSTWTVVALQGERPVLRLSSGGRESEFPFHTTPPGWSRGKATAAGTEEIEAGGRKYACTVTRIAFEEGKDASQVTTIARCEDAPVWALRRRVETFMGGKRNTLEEERLVAADQKLRIGDVEVTCQVVEVTVEAAGAPRTVKREWRSDLVPGRVARRETRYWQGGKEVESAATLMEVVSFKSKK